jgi:hypothetical protein
MTHDEKVLTKEGRSSYDEKTGLEHPDFVVRAGLAALHAGPRPGLPRRDPGQRGTS